MTEGYYWIVWQMFDGEWTKEPEIAEYRDGDWLTCGWDLKVAGDVRVLSCRLEPPAMEAAC